MSLQTKLIGRDVEGVEFPLIKDGNLLEKALYILLRQLGFNKVRDKYISIMKMRINLELFDPMIAENKRYKREVKRLQKEQQKRQEIQVKDEVQTI